MYLSDIKSYICLRAIYICPGTIYICLGTIYRYLLSYSYSYLLDIKSYICLGAICICLGAIYICLGAIYICLGAIYICLGAICICLGAIYRYLLSYSYSYLSDIKSYICLGAICICLGAIYICPGTIYLSGHQSTQSTWPRNPIFVRHNLTMHRSVTPFVIRQPIWRPCLLEKVYKPMRTSH